MILLAYVFAGEMTVYVGGQQPHQDMSTGSNVLQDTFTVKL